MGRAALGAGDSAAARGRGKRKRELRGADSLPHLGRGWRVEAGRREQVAAALAVCGGGAGSLGEERAVVVGGEKLEGDVEALL